MGGTQGRFLPVILVLTTLLFFGCLGPEQVEDTFGPKVEEMNSQISGASSASAVANLQTEVATLRSEAEADEQYSKYLPLIEAQELTLEVLEVYYDFQTEAAALSSGVDCSEDYSAFITKLKAVESTGDSAVSKANSYLSTNPESTADKLVSAVGVASPESMVAYAEILENEIARDCPATVTPSVSYDLPLSYEDALSIAAEEAGDLYYVYGFQETLSEGSVITATRAMGDKNFTLDSDTWFFFLDSDPWGPFGHDVKYVIIDAETAEYAVSEEDMYPIVDDAEYWKSADDRTNPDNVLYPSDVEGIFDITLELSETSDTHYLYRYPLATDVNTFNQGKTEAQVNCCPEKEKYALILTGSNDSMFQADTADMYSHLKGDGFSDANIYYLSSKTGVAGSDGVTTVAKLAEGLNWLKSKATCCDEVFIYLAGHGSKDPVRQFKHKTTNQTKWIRRVADLGANPGDWEATGRTGDYHHIDVSSSAGRGGASSEALNTFIKGINSCYVTIMYQSCHSGAAAPTLAATPGVTVMTPVDKEHSSYGATVDFGDWHVGSFFTQAYIAAKGANKTQADKNGDGTVTENEAFDYANKANSDVIEGLRARLRAAAEAEDDPVKKARLLARANALHEQNGVYQTGPPCWCCYIDCNESTDWLCTVFEAFNKPNCEECKGKKVGDLCKNETPDTGLPPPPEDDGGVTVGGGETGEGDGETTGGDGGTGTEPEPVCGDGNITGTETCDYGSTTTNKCPEGEYCHDSCVCKPLETSVVCGDGKISKPGEDCDGGNVKFNICPDGYTCSICKCVLDEPECGDGTVTPPEECDHGNSYTAVCRDGKTCSSCKCLSSDEIPEEAYCGNDEREGAEECDGTDASACDSDQTCSGCVCVDEEPECGDGDVEGNEECEEDADCDEGQTCSDCFCVDEEPVCGDGDVEGAEECEDSGDCSNDWDCVNCRCVEPDVPDPYCGDDEINGNEECDGSSTGCDSGGVCSGGCTCVYKPNLNCNEICSYTSGASLIATDLASGSECQAATTSQFPSETCYTTCRYSWLYRVDNIAGFSSCCCGMKKQFACDDCPCIVGETCPSECPDPETTCPANAPSWQAP